eukprot:6215144-Alexandrium_andersonii.AAC.1
MHGIDCHACMLHEQRSQTCNYQLSHVSDGCLTEGASGCMPGLVLRRRVRLRLPQATEDVLEDHHAGPPRADVVGHGEEGLG